MKLSSSINGFESLILGSTSVFRQQQLNKLHIPFDCAKPTCDETPLTNETPQNLVKRLSINKAKSLKKQFSNSLIIGSDQVAVCQNKILGKPLTHKNAVKQLTFLSGNKVMFYTGLCLYNAIKQTFQISVIPFTVTFRQLSAQQIENYLKTDEPYNCAGSFKSEALGVTLFKNMQGDDPSALIGLPLIALTSMLNQEGIVLPLGTN